MMYKQHHWWMSRKIVVGSSIHDVKNLVAFLFLVQMQTIIRLVVLGQNRPFSFLKSAGLLGKYLANM